MTDPSPETFAAVADLIRLIADPDGCAKRVRELQKLGEQVAKAQAKLETERAAHDQTVTADTAAALARETKLRDREVAVAMAQRDVAARERALADARPPRFSDDPNLGPGGRSHSGLTRNEASR
jgi:hypothetical protein